jgi:hypothetical protein
VPRGRDVAGNRIRRRRAAEELNERKSNTVRKREEVNARLEGRFSNRETKEAFQGFEESCFDWWFSSNPKSARRRKEWH